MGAIMQEFGISCHPVSGNHVGSLWAGRTSTKRLEAALGSGISETSILRNPERSGAASGDEIVSAPDRHGPRRSRAVRRRMPRVLEDYELDRFLTTVRLTCPRRVQDRAMMAVMVGAGLRVSEVCHLRPRDFRRGEDVTDGSPMVYLEVRGGKGSKDRTVPVGSDVVEWWGRWDALRPKEAETFFCTRNGTRMMSRHVERMFQRVTKQSGLPGPITPHTLRHTYATMMLSRGLSVRDVQFLLGHESLATTQRYVHCRPRELARKIRAIDVVEDRGIALTLRKFIGRLDDEQKRRLIRLLDQTVDTETRVLPPTLYRRT